MTVKAIPEGYHSLTPYLILNSAVDAMAFYERAFGATEVMRLDAPDGTIMHAEMRVGDSHFMLTDECGGGDFRSPMTLGGAGVSMMLYVESVDDVFAEAVAAGAEVMRPVGDQFYGDRMGTVKDPYGHIWSIASHIEDVSESDMQARFAAMMEQGNDGES